MRHVRTIALVVSTFALGGIVGAVTAYEYFDIKLTEGSGDLLGAALGAALAVGGAAWISERSEDRRRRQGQAAIEYTFREVLAQLETLSRLCKSSNPGRDDVQAAHDRFEELHEIAIARLDDMKPAFQAQGLPGVQLYHDLLSLSTYQRRISEIIANARNMKKERLDQAVKAASHEIWRYHGRFHNIVRGMT